MREERVEEFQAADVAYDVAMRRLDEQMRQIDAIDNKITFFMTISTTIVGLFAGFAAITVDTNEAGSYVTGIAFIVIVAVMYVFVMISGFWGASAFYKWDLGPTGTSYLQIVNATLAPLCVRGWPTRA